MREEGFEVLRFWNNEVFENLEGVLETLRSMLCPPHLTLSAEGEGKGRKIKTYRPG